MLDGMGGLGTCIKKSGGSFRITGGAKSGNVISPKYYQSAWKGGSVARITTYNMVKVGKFLGRAGTIGTIAIGSVDIYHNYKKENSFGKETQKAVGGLVGGLGGSAGGGALGAYIGAHFFGVGAIPGGIIGSIIGGWLGGEAGVELIQE